MIRDLNGEVVSWNMLRARPALCIASQFALPDKVVFNLDRYVVPEIWTRGGQKRLHAMRY